MEKTTREIDQSTARWYVVYTTAKTENKVRKSLEQSGFETFLPLQSVVRVWSNRKRKVVVPIIPRIIFVYLSKNNMEQITSLNKGGFLLQERGHYVSISSEQMEALCSAIEKSKEPVELLPEELDAEIRVKEQLSKEQMDLKCCSTIFILPIKGLGVISVKVGTK